jgi:integrase
MPQTRNKEEWVQHYREQLREIFAKNSGWYVRKSSKKIRIEIKGDIKQSKTLHFDWSKKGFAEAIPEIQQIYKRFHLGKSKTLDEACEVVKVSDSNKKIDFQALIKKFRDFVPNASEELWNKSYVPVLHIAQELLERSKGKPQNGEELLMLSLKKWEQGSRSRQIARRALTKFLNWAVSRIKLPAAYAPPPIQPEARKPKKIGYAFSDQQILALIEDETNPQWQFAYQLLAVYGLRPEELRWLRIIDGVNGKELHSIYQKSMGGLRGDKTKPRKLQPLFVKDGDGNPIDWKLQQRIEISEELPPLGSDGQGGLALYTHIKRRKLYQLIKDEASKIGQDAVPYSFRHRYAKASHASGFPIANIAQAMGHTPEVHLQNYSRFAPDKTTDLYTQANKQIA